MTPYATAATMLGVKLYCFQCANFRDQDEHMCDFFSEAMKLRREYFARTEDLDPGIYPSGNPVYLPTSTAMWCPRFNMNTVFRCDYPELKPIGYGATEG